MFIYCRFLFEKFNLFKLIFSSEILFEVQVRIDLSLFAIFKNRKLVNNTNLTKSVKFKFTDYFNNFSSKTPFLSPWDKTPFFVHLLKRFFCSILKVTYEFKARKFKKFVKNATLKNCVFSAKIEISALIFDFRTKLNF